MTSYCTISDIRLITGVSSDDVADSVITGLIGIADTRCNTRITEAGIPLPLTNVPDTLKGASANLAAAYLIQRMRTDLTRPASLSVDGLTYSTSDEEIRHYVSLGLRFLESFISDTLEISGTVIGVVEGD